ncbi:MAG TPA: beta-glucosidase [Acidobacteria bacterium]|nr:beta-glucosidase [Acidobacteriota bacterium]
MSPDSRFPRSFLWGAATSAYQVEGSPLADGAGPSIWQRFAHTPGRVRGGDTGDVACDHYRRFEEDVRWMRELGLNAYRFSVSWSRVLPEGTGRVNQRGLDFYRRLVDALLSAGIQPAVTLYHWDLPAALDDRGGWLNRDVAEWFAEYASVLFGALDDRVEMWATLNEPWVVTDGGYLTGDLAPGHRNLFEAPRAAHNLLRAHASAVQAYRAQGQHRIGLVVNLEPKDPASGQPEDLAATARADAYMNRQFLDPVFLGRSPEEMREIFGAAWPDPPAADFDHIRQPIDFLGINYYTRSVTCADPAARPVGAGRVRQPRHAYTETDWEVYPAGLTQTLLGVRQRYGDIPLYVTENGAAFYDPPTVEGDELADPLRVAYLRTHLQAVQEARRHGVDVRGYFAWSLLDNFEWSHGYSKRFGLLHVDFETQRRTPKASARFYAEVIRSRGEALLEGRLPA